jgi:hypothetical protein
VLPDDPIPISLDSVDIYLIEGRQNLSRALIVHQLAPIIAAGYTRKSQAVARADQYLEFYAKNNTSISSLATLGYTLLKMAESRFDSRNI